MTAERNGGTDEALMAGMLGALGLVAVGGVAFAASRRRRRSADTVSEDSAFAEADRTFARTDAETQFVANPVSFANSVPTATNMAPVGVSQTTQRVSGDPFPLPESMPQTFDERDALLKELVAAEPDRANPFTSVRARARRAKLIMQSLGEDFRSRKPRIDLSEYSNRWPALRGWQPATA